MIFYRIQSYLKFLLRAKTLTGHGIHSPFVFHLTSEILKNVNKTNAGLKSIKELRKNLAKDNRKINWIDLGARQQKSKQKNVKHILKQSVSRQKYLELLFALVKEFQPSQIIELGTSLGISTAAMALAAPSSKVITVEGCKDIALVASENFLKLGLTNVHQETGIFDDVLPTLLSESATPFFVFMDGNHSYEATIRYFNQIIEKAVTGSIVILDDIHWSAGMEKAWNEIKKNGKVSISIDIYQMGLIFLRVGVEKQYFCIKY